MAKIDITKIDRLMAQQKIDPEGLRWLDPRDGGFDVLGLHWFDREKRYNRFPRKMSWKKLRPALLHLAVCTAGGQLRFRTDSRRIVISVKNPPIKSAGKTPETAKASPQRKTGRKKAAKTSLFDMKRPNARGFFSLFV